MGRKGGSFEEKIKESKRILRLASEMSKKYYGAPLIITYSGGKDSDVLLHLAESCLSKDDFEVLHSHTSVDAPETVYHIREVFARLRGGGIKATVKYATDKDGKRITMWNLIPKKQMPPTAFQRYCCAILKETGTPNRMAVLGVRSDESTKRKGRDTFGVRGESYKDATFFSTDHAEEVLKESIEHESEENGDVWDCTLIKAMKEHGDTVVNPIYTWTDDDVWGYVRSNNIPMNPLYSMGYKRVGCVGCPIATYGQSMRDFRNYPKYKEAYIRAFDRMLTKRIADGKENKNGWVNGQAVFDWWIQRWKHETKGQMTLGDFINGRTDEHLSDDVSDLRDREKEDTAD